VIGVGPMKTGSTHIQGILGHSSTRDMLLEDGFVFIGNGGNSNWFQENHLPELDFRAPSMMILSHGQANLKDALIDLYDRGLNAILYMENLSGLCCMNDENATKIYDMIGSNWNVQVVGAYRRLYDWLPSVYQQQVRPNERKQRNIEHSLWPGQKQNDVIGEVMPPFDLEAAALAEKFLYIEDTGLHPVQIALSPWIPHIDDVTVFNMNEDFPQVSIGDPFTIFFACNVMRQLLPKTCRAATMGLVGMRSTLGDNPSFPINYDILATSAYEAGLIDPKLSRIEVIARITTHQADLNKTVTDFPLTCLSNNTLERLFNVSLRTELSVYPEKNSEEAEAKLREGFAANVAAQKYCSINATQVLQDSNWMKYLRSLKP
jgi:hypothetical protein